MSKCGWFVLVVALLLGGCTYTVPIDRLTQSLRSKDVRTVSLEPRFTLISPYNSRRTARVSRIIREELSAVGRLFELDVNDPIFIELKPLPVEGFEMMEGNSTFQVTGFPRPPTHCGIAGAAGTLQGSGRPAVVIYVARDHKLTTREGTTLPVSFLFNYRSTIRHELAHVCFRLADLDGPHWFNEGVAVAVESMVLEDGGLEHHAYPAHLATATRCHRDHRMSRLLEWKESLEMIARSEEAVYREGRPLAMSLVRFLLEREGDVPFLAALKRIAALPREELLKLEHAWHAWLAERGRGVRSWR